MTNSKDSQTGKSIAQCKTRLMAW